MSYHLGIIFIATSLKLLLLNTYHSTDFEVHRNWLAITSSLPLAKWYKEETSQWTLDYPPFFAWFEYVLSNIAAFFDEQMLVVENLEYASQRTVLFQRLSVIFCDFFLIYAVFRYISGEKKNKSFKDLLENGVTPSYFVACSIICNFGLFLVDHIHFQYNGFFFAMLILSISCLAKGKYLHSAFWFMVLLNFKHIFLYVAPVYFVFLLRSYCFRKSTKPLSGVWSMLGANVFDILIVNLFKLAFIVLAIFFVSFGPFIYMNQLTQVLSRLFPVKRGLCHAYWAANFWACYNVLDKILIVSANQLGLKSMSMKPASMTGGLVAQQDFQILPNVSPIVTAIVTLLFMMPALLKLWYRPFRKDLFIPALVLCGYCSFLFGYHVHEKAILMIIIPLTLIAPYDKTYARVYVIAQTVGHYALFPLLYQRAEIPIKLSMFLIFTLMTLFALKHIVRSCRSSLGIPFVTWFEALYLYGLVPLYIFTDIMHPQIKGLQKYEFMPLLTTSLYCSLGVIWSFVVFLVYFVKVL